jgi:hypothetical protein
VTAASQTGDVAVRMGVLQGDTNGDASVNSADISQTKSQSGQPLQVSNFREDLNTDGAINSADIGFTKSKSGTALPPDSAVAPPPAATTTATAAPPRAAKAMQTDAMPRSRTPLRR